MNEHRLHFNASRYNIRRYVGSILCCTIGRHAGNYLALTYVFVKLLYIANAIGQIFLLNLFMGRGFSMIGLEALNRWWKGQEMEVVERFPRISMCKFMIRTLGDNIQPFDVQCLLPINIYNEKIFLLIWFWLAFVAVTSIYGLLKWVYYFTGSSRKNFVERFLQANDIRYYQSSSMVMRGNEDDGQGPRKYLDDFVEHYCRQDGLLLLRLIKKNTNRVITGEVICALWDNWKGIPRIQLGNHGNRMTSFGGESPLKARESSDVNEKLLPPM